MRWTPEAEARVARAPLFLRGMVRRLAEKRARAEGVDVITPELMTRYKSEMMGLAESGAYKVPQPAPPWTPEALALLEAVPPFMRPMTRRICEELAAEHGAAAVTPASHAGGRGGGRDRDGGGAAAVDAGGPRRGSSPGSGRRRP